VYESGLDPFTVEASRARDGTEKSVSAQQYVARSCKVVSKCRTSDCMRACCLTLGELYVIVMFSEH